MKKLTRRTFVGESASAGLIYAVAGAAPSAGVAAGNVIDFEEAGGSVTNSGERNRRVYLNAVAKLARSGGGTLAVPAKVYPFSGEASTDASNVTVFAPGATFKGDDCRLTLQWTSSGFNIDGLTLIETSGAASAVLLNCMGSNCHFKDMHLEKNPVAKGYIAYCQQETSGNLFENVSFAGSNGMFMGGHDHEVRGGWAEAGFGDDCWVLKAAIAPCYNIRISGFRARGFAALLSIGSEVGSLQADDPAHSHYVRGITVENCSAENCVYFAYIKPGAIEIYDYRDGLVEDVTITNCTIEDSKGARFRDGIYISPGRGAIVRRIAVNNLSVTARGGSPAIQHISGMYLYVLNTTNGAGQGATIDQITLNGLRCVDPYGGVATSEAAPGKPIQVPIAIEKRSPDIGALGAVNVVSAMTDGCARMAVFVGKNVEGPIKLIDSEFRNFAAAILASSDATAVLALSPVQIENVVATASPYAPPGTRELPA